MIEGSYWPRAFQVAGTDSRRFQGHRDLPFSYVFLDTLSLAAGRAGFPDDVGPVIARKSISARTASNSPRRV